MTLSKLLNWRVSGAICLSFFIASCSSTPDSLSVIPSETQMVCNVDILAIAQKGHLNEISEFRTVKTVQKEIRRENRRVSGIFEDLIEDPSSTGINFTKDVQIFVLKEAEREMYVGVSFVLNDALKFEEMLEDLMDELGADYDTDEEESFTYMLVDNDAVFGWDKSRALLLVGEGSKARENLDYEIEDLFTLEEKDQILSSSDFANFYSNKKDVSLWLSSSLGEDEREFRELENVLNMDLTELILNSHLSFEDDEIVLTSSVVLNEDLTEMVQEYPILGKVNDELSKYIPQESFTAAACGINPMSIYEIISESREIDGIEDEFRRETNMDLKDMFESIGGSAMFSISGYEQMEYTYMDWGYGFNEATAKRLDERYSISEAGYLTQEEIDQLNEGETIQCRAFSYKYCIDIKNILEDGYDCQYAIDNASLINWFEGGWDYGPYLETTREELLPVMTLVADLNNSDPVDDLIDEAPEDVFEKHGDYYEFMFERRYPAFFAFTPSAIMITNDEKVAKDFADGGVDPNFGSNSHSSNAGSNAFYGYSNLNPSDYPRDVKNALEDEMRGGEEKLVYDIWRETAREIEVSLSPKGELEASLVLQPGEGNSLYRILSILDDNVRNMMDM